MSITNFQRNICQLIAANRISSGESYVAGGVALNQMIGAARFSTDIDLFHDTQEALNASWLADTVLLQEKGFEIRVRVQYPSFIETIVKLGEETMILQWAQDSAYRFFPLQEHPIFGLTLHPFDLATNKTLALVGRLEPRDWIDMISSHDSIQPLGYLAWAASGKDPGLSPPFILEEAARSNRYTQIEIDAMPFAGSPPSAIELSQRWRRILQEAREIVDVLPATATGACILDSYGNLLCCGAAELQLMLQSNQVRYHSGCIRGAYPTMQVK